MSDSTDPHEFWRVMRLRQVTFDASFRRGIARASQRYAVPASLIASVMADERTRLDLADRVQDRVMRLSLRLPPRSAALLIRCLERVCGRSVETFSLGRAQMKPATLELLGRRGYLTVAVGSRDRRALLLADREAPALVAACLRATVDHWQAQGVSLAQRPEILGTLYSLGLTGVRGVHRHPHASARGRAIAAHTRWLEAQGVFNAAPTSSPIRMGAAR